MRDKKTWSDKTKEELIVELERLQKKNYMRKKALSQINRSVLVKHHMHDAIQRQVNYWREEALTLRYKLDKVTTELKDKFVVTASTPEEAVQKFEAKHASGA